MSPRVEVPGGEPIELQPALERLTGHDLPARLVHAAAHVAMQASFAEVEADEACQPEVIARHVDWGATLELRRHLDRQGFGIAESMDTAQRFEIGWPLAEELIRRTGELDLEHGFVAGASADHLPQPLPSLDELADGLAWQAHRISECGGQAVLLCQPALVDAGLDEDGYVAFYERVIAAAPAPLFVHWLGPMFHPGLVGYFPGRSFERVMALAPERVRGAKLSLLDASLELRLRRELGERDQLLLTGDDWNFAALIAGGHGEGQAPVTGSTWVAGLEVATGDFSHALLGVFDAIAIPAGRALQHLARGESPDYHRLMAPCEELGRLLFAEPTAHYKTGLAFLAWLDGRQDEFLLPCRLEGARDREHLLQCARLAAAARCFEHPETVARRLTAWLARS